MRTVPLAVLLVAFFILGSMVSIPTAHALDPNWTGAAGDGKWETPGNWDGHVVPGPFDAANILPGTFVVTISTAQSALTLTVSLGDTVTCESTCTLALTTLSNAGTFTNFGTVTSPNGILNFGTFTNYGTVILSGAFVNVGTFTNRCHGTVNMTPVGAGTFTTDPTCPAPSGPVGGFVEPVNKLAVFAPYLTLLGVIGAVAVVFWKRPQN